MVSYTFTHDGDGGTIIILLRVLPLGDGSCQRVWGRPEDDTRDPGRFPIFQDFGEGWKVDQKRSEKRGALLLSLLSDAPVLPTGAGECVNRPYHVQNVLRTHPGVT